MRALSRLWPAAAALALLGMAPRGAGAQAADTETAPPQHSPVYNQMRQEALTTPPEELEFEGRRPPRVWGSVMELGLPSGRVATLIVFADGTTTLLSSAGGGIVGSGAQRTVRRASEEFLEEAAEANRGMADAAESPLPAPGRVRFYLRTHAGLRTAEAGEDELKAGSHALSELYEAGQGVLAQVRPLPASATEAPPTP